MRPLVLAILPLLLAGCAANDATEGATSPGSNESGTDAMDTVAVPAAVSLFEAEPGPGIVGVPPRTMGIDPARLELKVGVPVNLTITNDGAGGHDLVIDGLDVDTDVLDAGASVTVEFTPTEAGTFAMYCSVGGDSPMGHRAQGMSGEVVVA